MHELAIAESLIDAVTEHTGPRQVRSVRLEIGRLAGIVPDALRFCFDVAADDTPLAGARLDIEEPPGRARCRSCGQAFDVEDLILLCPCGSADVEVTCGQQLRLVSVEAI